jgi:hypothetical protein
VTTTRLYGEQLALFPLPAPPRGLTVEARNAIRARARYVQNAGVKGRLCAAPRCTNPASGIRPTPGLCIVHNRPTGSRE